MEVSLLLELDDLRSLPARIILRFSEHLADLVIDKAPVKNTAEAAPLVMDVSFHLLPCHLQELAVVSAASGAKWGGFVSRARGQILQLMPRGTSPFWSLQGVAAPQFLWLLAPW